MSYEQSGVAYHRQLDSLFNSMLGLTGEETPKQAPYYRPLYIVFGECPLQRVGNDESVSMRWRRNIVFSTVAADDQH